MATPMTVDEKGLEAAAKAAAMIDGINLGWIADQTNPRWRKYRQVAEVAITTYLSARSAEPVAWRHTVLEPGFDERVMLSQSPANPWSHWVAAHREKCAYTCTPLYAHPATTTVADARIKALSEASQLALTTLDKMMGDTDPPGDTPELLACQALSRALSTPEPPDV